MRLTVIRRSRLDLLAAVEVPIPSVSKDERVAISGTSASNAAFAVSAAFFGFAVVAAVVGVNRRIRSIPAARYISASLALLVASALAMAYAATPA
jgi:hypothetical protein